MEKVVTNSYKEKNEAITKESLNLINRNVLQLEGVLEVISSSDNELYLKLKNTTLYINGANLQISKLDVKTGELEATGEITSIKYGKNKNIFKRIFK